MLTKEIRFSFRCKNKLQIHLGCVLALTVVIVSQNFDTLFVGTAPREPGSKGAKVNASKHRTNSIHNIILELVSERRGEEKTQTNLFFSCVCVCAVGLPDFSDSAFDDRKRTTIGRSPKIKMSWNRILRSLSFSISRAKAPKFAQSIIF